MDPKVLVNKYGLKISRLASRMLTDKDMARDAVQEVWYEVLKSLGSFKGDSEISTWIYTIAKRTIQKYSKNERLVLFSDIDQCISKGQIVYNDSEQQKEEWIKEKCDDCITAFCHCLTNDSRLIFLFRENLNLSYGQISRIMDISEDNVRQVSSRSLKKIRNYMNKECVLLNPLGNCGCRIKNVIKSIDYDKKYAQLTEAYRLVDFYNKFDKELPLKNYWIKYLSEVVTNEGLSALNKR
jgi:RNA polymerase sigma factor (sigma-70 family)